jgi:hypothetical protein
VIWFPVLTRFQPALPYLNPLILNRLRTLSSFRAVTLRRPSFISSDLRTLWRGLFSQPTSYQCLPHSLRKTPGGTGSQFLQPSRVSIFEFRFSSFDFRLCSFLQFIAAFFRTDPFLSATCRENLQCHPGGGLRSAHIRSSAAPFGSSFLFNFQLSTADCFWLSFLP